MSARCQVQYLHPHRRTWIDCAKKAPITLVVNDIERQLCTEHRDEVRRVVTAGLAVGLRWSEEPSPVRPPQASPNGQLRLVDVPATGRKRRRSR